MFTDPESVANALIAFGLFCIASSASYILNDIHDIERDRTHPVKRHSRPLAAGTVSIRAAVGLLVACYCVLVAGWFWSVDTMLAIFAYLALNVAYTYWLKHQPVLDLFSIASGFVLRAYAGALALGVPLSSWMAITTLCLALYLAAIKLCIRKITQQEIRRLYGVTAQCRGLSANGAINGCLTDPVLLSTLGRPLTPR